MSHHKNLLSGCIGFSLGIALVSLIVYAPQMKHLVLNHWKACAAERSDDLPPSSSISEDQNIREIQAALDAPLPQMTTLHGLRATCNSLHHISLYFSSPEHIHLSPGENLLITPDVAQFRVERTPWDSGFRLYGEFSADTTYTITVKSGTRSVEDRELMEDAIFSVTTPSAEPSVAFFAWRGQMPLTPESALACSFLACEAITVEVYRAFDNNLPHYGQSTWRDNLLAFQECHTFKVPLDKKNKRQMLLPFHTLVNGRPGIYRFRISTPNGTSSDDCYIILSNIGATYAYHDPHAPVVALHDLRDGTPIVNARLAFYDHQNQCFATATSDANGFAHATPTPLSGTHRRWGQPKRIIITSGDDTTLIECDSATRHSAYQPTATKLPSFPAHIWPDRDGIHPGEAVQLYGIIRTQTLAAAKEIPLTLKIFTPSEHLLTSAPVTSNADGVFTTALTIPDGAKTGTYEVQLLLDDEVLHSTTLYVADFVANHVKLSLDFANAQPDRLLLTTATYFGTPVTKGNGSYILSAYTAPLPKAWEEWTFGPDEEGESLKQESFSKNSIDKQVYLEGIDPAMLSARNTPTRLIAELSFNEPNSRAVSTTATLDLSPHPAYLGARYDESSASLEFKQFSTLERKIEPGTLQILQLEELRHDYALVEKNGQLQYEWTTNKVPIDLTPYTSTTHTITDTSVCIPLKKLQPGHYVVTARLNDRVSTTLQFWHNCASFGERLANPFGLTFKTDKPRYRAGETASLTFDAPVDGRVVITAGDTRLRHFNSLAVQAGTITIPITIPADCTYGTWHTAVTLIASNPQKNGRYFGVASLPVDHTNRALNVNLNLPKVVRPQDTISVTLQLTDTSGQPCRGTVALFAVDEAVLDVTGFETPAPHDELFQRDERYFVFGDIYGTLLPQLKLGLDGRIGGGKSQSNELNMDANIAKATTVLTLPLQTIDASGTLTLPVTLPDFSGSLRFMAVASNDARVGAADSTLIVRQPATLTLSGARYGAPGDSADYTVRVINHDFPESPYSVTIGSQTFTGILANGQTSYHTLHLPIGNHTATLCIGDFTTEVTHEVHVHDEIPPHNRIVIRRLPEGASLPEGAEALPSLDAMRNVALDWLADYPYACTEQLSARMLPYTAGRNETEQAFVKNWFAQLSTRLLSSGKFTLWHAGSYISETATLFASQVFIEGVRAQILPSDNLEIVLDALFRMAMSTNSEERDQAAYATFLLGEAQWRKAAIRAARNILISDETDMAAFVAAATLVFNGAADEGAPKMKAFLKANPRPQTFMSPYLNATATQALVLDFALRAGVCTDEEIGARVAALFEKSWDTTQANAWIARALSNCTTLPEGTFYRLKIHETTLPENPTIRVTKRLVNAKREPITTLKHGELAFVEILFTLPAPCDNLVIRDRLPGGLEYEDANLASRESVTLPQWAEELNRFTSHATENLGYEQRFFGPGTLGENVILYPVRASTSGTFAIPAVTVEDMYSSNISGGDNPNAMLTIQ